LLSISRSFVNDSILTIFVSKFSTKHEVISVFSTLQHARWSCLVNNLGTKFANIKSITAVSMKHYINCISTPSFLSEFQAVKATYVSFLLYFVSMEDACIKKWSWFLTFPTLVIELLRAATEQQNKAPRCFLAVSMKHYINCISTPSFLSVFQAVKATYVSTLSTKDNYGLLGKFIILTIFVSKFSTKHEVISVFSTLQHARWSIWSNFLLYFVSMEDACIKKWSWFLTFPTLVIELLRAFGNKIRKHKVYYSCFYETLH
jgi:hypothetical protein